MTNSEGFIPSTEYFSKEVYSKSLATYKIVKPGMFAYNPSRINVGSVNRWIGEAPVIVSPLYIVVNPDPRRIEGSYLNYFLHSKEALCQIRNLTEGTVRDSLKFSGFQRLTLPLPPLPTQQRIADELDRLCALKKNAEDRLAILDQIVKSRFVEMFGGDDFNKDKLSACVEQMFIGPFGSSLKNECFVDVSDAYCMVYEQKHAIHKDMTLPARYVNREKYDELRRFEVGPGDIIVSCRGTVGEVFLIPDDAPTGIIHPSIMKIRLKRGVFDNTYFLFALRKFMIDNEHRAQGSGVKMAVTATVLGHEEFVIPPLALQREFAAFVGEVDKSKLTLRETVATLDQLYRAKLQEYFG